MTRVRKASLTAVGSTPRLRATVQTCLLVLFLSGRSLAGQNDYVPDVQWAVALQPAEPARAGDPVVLQVKGDIPAGWHVYALTEPPGGPTALRLSVDADHTVVSSVGDTAGPKPHKRHDRSFDLETETYSGKFALEVPLRIRDDLAVGRYRLPISLRFQSCSDAECRPPRTVVLTADILIRPHTQALN